MRMKKEITAESFRSENRVKNEEFSSFIDARYKPLYEIVEYMYQHDIPATRVETPFGDVLITKKLL